MSAPEALTRALVSLEGLSVGDAFGDQFFASWNGVSSRILARELPSSPWRYTDDTQMALSVVGELRENGAIDQDLLAKSFAEHFDPSRQYGANIQQVLASIKRGMSWQAVSKRSFGGQGSMGNGAAMRVAPLGAFYAGDLAKAAEAAALTAEVTHSHSEGIAGAVAVAVAAGLAWQLQAEGIDPHPSDFLNSVLDLTPDGLVAANVRRARDLPDGSSVRHAAAVLGNGTAITAPDTVPFALWCAATFLTDYEEAMWETVSAFGDMDTNCAIAGGVVAAYVGQEGIPDEWRRSREPLGDWFLQDC